MTAGQHGVAPADRPRTAARALTPTRYADWS
jgi:hypothetical protein